MRRMEGETATWQEHGVHRCNIHGYTAVIIDVLIACDWMRASRDFEFGTGQMGDGMQGERWGNGDRGGSGSNLKGNEATARGNHVINYDLANLCVRCCLNSLTLSCALARCDAGSHVLSYSGYPSHLTKYSRRFERPIRRVRCAKMRSTSYASSPSGRMSGGGRSSCGR